MLSQEGIDFYAKAAADQIVKTYVCQAQRLGLDLNDIKRIIRRTAEVAVKILDKQPA